MPWYIATLIFDRYSDRHWVDRELRLIHAADAESAYSIALELGNSPKNLFRFAGLDDLQELGDNQPGHGDSVWQRSMIGLPASEFVQSKNEMSVFDEARGWLILRPDRHDLK